MNKIDQKLQEIRERKKIGFMTHVVVGYPSLHETEELVILMANEGTDFIELQIPFSDPLADGATIMTACEKALGFGTRVIDAFQLVKNLQKKIKIPLLFMCYYNTVFQYGVEKFCKDSAESGISGLIVPDMPLDEEREEHFYYFANKYKLSVIQVVSPASTKERLQKVAQSADGFVYATAHQGITGAKNNLNEEIGKYLHGVKKYIKIPIAVGFGIAKPQHIQILQGKADIAVVGSKMLDIISSTPDYKGKVKDFLKRINVVKSSL